MALQRTYKQFLASPNVSLLADDASLHYITTLTSVHGATDILKHLGRQTHELKKKDEKFLSAIEDTKSLAVESQSTIEFVNGGGAYLPGLDDNFLADRTVQLAIIHIVNFDANGKIQQIRQNWDQGSLLKQIDIIGRTGKNWPIRDGKDQVKLITSSLESSGQAPSDTKSVGSSAGRSRGNSDAHPTGDPHASLNLFAPREIYDGDSYPAEAGPRQSIKPAQRNFNDLFVQNGNEAAIDSPAKTNNPNKFAASRLFDEDDSNARHIGLSPKVNEKKFQHFDFGDGDNEEQTSQPVPLRQSKKQHTSQWGFEDFNTPAKVVPHKLQRHQDNRHWGTEDDEVIDSPIKFEKVNKPRKDAAPQFEFKDDGTPEGDRRQALRPRGAQGNKGMGLYTDHVLGEDEATPTQKKNAHHHDSNERRKVFDSQFAMADVSPAQNKPAQHISEERAKAVKNMDANWGSYDQSPVANQKENNPPSPTHTRASKGPLSDTTNQGINIAGDGMGGRKVPIQQEQRQRGIATGGDGMGGRKGASRGWGFGDESGDEEQGPLFKTGKATAHKRQPTGGNFWDF